MKKSKDRKKRRQTLLLVTLMGVGFALISAQIAIGGRAVIKKTIWDIHFDNVQVTEGSVAAETPVISNDGTSVDYNITLDLPGDYYEFTVDVVNNSNINAILSSIAITGLPQDIRNAIDYGITYLDGTTIYGQDIIKKNTTQTYLISVRYKEYISRNYIIPNETQLNLSLTAVFERSDVYDNEEQTDFTKLVRDRAKNDRSINFQESSSTPSNGLGLYLLSGTEEDIHPIYYYRGMVDNNNAMFAGYCWKIVRTTENGGTKLLYNGRPSMTYPNAQTVSRDDLTNVQNDTSYPFYYDTETNQWISTNEEYDSTASISFSVQNSGTYYLKYSNFASMSSQGTIYVGDNQVGSFSQNSEGFIELGSINSSSVIRVEYYKQYEYDGYAMFSLISDLGEGIEGCNRNNSTSTQIGSTPYNNSNNSLAYSGYMYGTTYPIAYSTINSNYLFGTSFSYSGGNYTLTNTVTQKPDATHHYTCLNSTGTCSQVYYVYYYYSSYSRVYYITLTNGKNIDQAMEEMNVNTNDSAVKSVIDNWFSNEFVNYFTNLGKDYNNYLEDAIWCGDRSIHDKRGWNPIGETITNSSTIFYETVNRAGIGAPSLTCPVKNDAFTVSDTVNGNGALTYPVGLLTSDEIIMAGKGSSSYLSSSQYSWTMSPSSHYYSGSMSNYTSSSSSSTVTNSYGVRPSIVVSKDVKIASGGNGTPTYPYKFIVD